MCAAIGAVRGLMHLSFLHFTKVEPKRSDATESNLVRKAARSLRSLATGVMEPQTGLDATGSSPGANPELRAEPGEEKLAGVALRLMSLSLLPHATLTFMGRVTPSTLVLVAAEKLAVGCHGVSNMEWIAPLVPSRSNISSGNHRGHCS